MVIKKTDIKPASSISDAQGLKYGKTQRDLSTEEKKIFTSSFLNDATGSPDLVKIQETAIILEKVIDAAVEASFNQTVFNELTAFKSSSDPKNYAYKAINSNGNQFDNALTWLESKKPGYTPPDQSSIDKEIQTLEEQIVTLEAEIQSRDEQLKIPDEKYAQEMQKAQGFRDKIQKIEELSLRLKTGTSTSTTPIPVKDDKGNIVNALPILSSGVNINKVLEDRVNFLSDYTQAWVGINKFYKANFKGYDFGGRSFVSRNSLFHLNYQIAEYLREIDDTKMKSAISNSGLSSANKTQVLADWEHIKSDNFGFGKKETNSLNLNFYNSRELLTDNNSKGEFRFKSKGKISEIESSEWPLNNFSTEIFFRFIGILFPKSDVKGGELKNNSVASALNYKKEKEIFIKLLANDPTPKITSKNLITSGSNAIIDNQYVPVSLVSQILKKEGGFFIDEDDYRKQNSFEIKKLEGLEKVIGFWWDAFWNNSNVSGIVSIGDFNGTHLNISEVTDENYKIMVEWINNIRNTGEFPTDLISDDVLLKIVQESTEGLYNYRRKKKLKTTNSNKRKNDLAVSKVEMDYNNNHLVESATDFRRYLWLKPLRDEIVKLELEAYKAESRANGKKEAVGIIEREKADLEHQISSLRQKIDMKKTERDKLKGLDLPTLQSKFNAIYQIGKLYTKKEIMELENILEEIKEKCKNLNKTVEQSITDAETELNSRLYAVDVAKAETRIATLWGSMLKPNKEKIKDLVKSELEKYKRDLEKIATVRKLEQTEEDLKQVIQNKIDGQDDTPVTDLDEAKLNSALQTTGLVQADVDKWKVITNFSKESEIKGLVDKVKTDATFSKFQDHLDTHAYGEAKTAKGTDQWTNFVKKEPKVVIGAILYWTDYENASYSDKKAIKEAIETVNNSDKADKSDLWKTDDSQEGQYAITKYLYRTKTGKSFDVKKEIQTPQEDPSKKTGDDKPFWKSPLGITLWIVLGVLVIGGGLAWAFWDNIKKWWEPKDEDADSEEEDN